MADKSFARRDSAWKKKKTRKRIQIPCKQEEGTEPLSRRIRGHRNGSNLQVASVRAAIVSF